MRGLSSLNREGNISTIHFGLGTTTNVLKSVCEDRRGNVWVASNEGVSRVGDQGQAFYGVNEGLPDRVATVIYEDRSGRVWVGTTTGSLAFPTGKWLQRR